jgi:hypothetical protein
MSSKTLIFRAKKSENILKIIGEKVASAWFEVVSLWGRKKETKTQRKIKIQTQ